MTSRTLRLWAALGIALPLLATRAQSQTVVFNGDSFTNQGLTGIGRVPAAARDFFGDTLGGFGSGMLADLTSWRMRSDGTYAGTLFMVPDRGWNTQGTLDYQGRLQRFAITLNPYTGTAALPAGASQQSQLTLSLQQSLGLTDGAGVATSGLDPTGFRAAANGFPNLPTGRNGRVSLDNEGLVRGRDGSFWISDEYGPYIYRYDSNGRMLAAIRPPSAFIPIRNGTENFASNNPPAGQAAPSPVNPVTGRQNNQGFEGLAIAPDGRSLTALLQSANRQDGGDAAGTRFFTRMLTYDISAPTSPRLAAEYVVRLPFVTGSATLVAAQSEILQLNSKQYLMLSRDSAVGFTFPTAASSYRVINIVDVSGATNIAGSTFDGVTPVAPGGVLAAGVTPARVTPFLNLNDNSQLNVFGLRNGAPNDRNNLYEKWEGMALLPTLRAGKPNEFFLIVASDNDFITTNGSMQGTPYSEANDVDTVLLVYTVSLPTYIDPMAVQSLEVTALPLARIAGDMALQAGQSVAALSARRVFGLRTLTNDLIEAARPAWNVYATGNFAMANYGGYGSSYAYGPPGTSGRASSDPGVNAGSAGADYRILPQLRIGGALTYFGGSSEPMGSRIALSGAAVSVYGTAALGPTWFDLQYSYLFGDADIRRDTAIYGLTGSGKPSLDGHVVTAAVGHNLTAGPIVFGPNARLTHVNMSIDGYTETGALLASAAFPNQHIQTTTLDIGGQLSWPLNVGGMRIVPQLRAGYNVELSSNRRTVTVGLAERLSMPEAYVSGAADTLPQGGPHVGAGVLVRRDNLSFLVDYDAQVRRYGSVDHRVTVSAGLAF